MKILYLMKYPTQIKDNLVKKFNGQMNAMKELGYDVFYLEWNGKVLYLSSWNTGDKVFITKTRYLLTEEKYYHTFYFLKLYKTAAKAIKEEKFDVVYMRGMPSFPQSLRMVSQIKKNGCRFVVEIPTYLLNASEENTKGSVFRRLTISVGKAVSTMFEKKVFAAVDMFAVIGDAVNGELYSRPAVNISNGIDLNNIARRIYKNVDDNKTHILMLASMCYWHGFDRIIQSLEKYEKKDIIRLHFVGNDGDGSLAKWKKMTEDCGLTENVIFHGALYGDELNEVVNSSNIAVSSLGLYREKLYSASCLKTREYMARGIPFIYAGDDPCIEKDFKYAIQVSNDDSLFDMQKIVEFAEKMYKDANATDEMRNYAEAKMSWKSELAKVLKETK